MFETEPNHFLFKGIFQTLSVRIIFRTLPTSYIVEHIF